MIRPNQLQEFCCVEGRIHHSIYRPIIFQLMRRATHFWYSKRSIAQQIRSHQQWCNRWQICLPTVQRKESFRKLLLFTKRKKLCSHLTWLTASVWARKKSVNWIRIRKLHSSRRKLLKLWLLWRSCLSGGNKVCSMLHYIVLLYLFIILLYIAFSTVYLKYN